MSGRVRIAVIGGGAAGLAAAGAAGEAADGGADIVLFERNEKPGKKLYITGKGRCNVTNDCTPAEFLRHVVRNPKFLYRAINRFTPAEAMALIEANGTPLKTERGNRVFPVSDHASDITGALARYAGRSGTIRLNARVTDVSRAADGFMLRAGGEQFAFDKVIVATGGVSYPSTGSDGDGYRIAGRFGHTVVPPRPSLVPLLLDDDVTPLEGLSLKNVRARITADGTSHEAFGEMLFTSAGVSGPIVLTLSAVFARDDLAGAAFSVDLKPALDAATLDARILRDFSAATNRMLKNALDGLLPSSLIPCVLRYAAVAPDKPVHSVTAAERGRLVGALKNLAFTVRAADDISRAVVTAGGVDVREVNPGTMESRLVPGLYFAGEVLDVDALTGGFNIQTALSTGVAAGRHAGGNHA